LALLLTAFTAQADLVNHGARIVIGPDAVVSVDGDLVNQTDAADGEIDLDGGLRVSGNWSNEAGNTVFTPGGTGTVTLSGGDQALTGTTAFPNLTKQAAAPATLTFAPGVANRTTVEGAMVLTCANGGFLILQSASPGTPWQIDPQGTRTISWLEVEDSANVNATDINTLGHSCRNLGGNTGWRFGWEVDFLPGPGGSLAGPTVQFVEPGSDALPVTAIPDPDYVFTAWSGGYVGTDNPLTVTSVSGDMVITANFAAILDLTMALATGGTTVPAAGVHTVVEGLAEDIAAIPDVGYHFTQWQASAGAALGDANAATTTVTLSGDASVTPVFAINEYVVSFATDGTAGATVNGAALVTYTVSHGSDCTPATAVPPVGKLFASWIGDHVGTENPLTLTAVTGPMAVTATFADGTLLTLAADPPDQGTTVPDPAGGPYTIAVGTPFAIGAVAAPGHVFTQWTVDAGNATLGDAEDLTTTVTIADTGGATVTARFLPLVTLTLATGPGGGGSTEPAGPVTVALGSIVPILAIPAADHVFSSWSASANATLGDANAISTTATLAGDATVTANFAEILDLTMALATGGTTVPAAGVHTVVEGIAEDITAIPDVGYHFTQWQASAGATLGDANAATTTVTLTADAAVTPVFAINEYVVSFATDGTAGATVNGAALVTYTVSHGSDCTPVTAVPPPNFSFIGWSGDHVGMENPLTLTGVVSAMEVVAHFGKFVAQGRVLNLDADDVPDLATPGLFFLAPKIYGVYTDRFKDPFRLKPKKAALKLLEKPDKLAGSASLRTEWTKKLKLYSTKAHKAALKGGTATGAWLAVAGNQRNLLMDLQVASKEIADPDAKNQFRTVYGASLAAPEAISIVDGIPDAKGNATWLITGSWFGTKVPKAYREYTVDGKEPGTFVVNLQKLKTLKPTADNPDYQGYVDSKGKPTCMDPATGDSALVVLVPPPPKAGLPGDLVIDNGVGLAVIEVPGL